MLRNYLVVAIRNLIRQPLSSLISIGGLGIAVAFCLLTSSFVQHEWTYDAFHANAESIYRVCLLPEHPSESSGGLAVSPSPLGPASVRSLPQVVATVRFKPEDAVIEVQGDSYAERVLHADPSVFRVFTFPLVSGDPETALDDRRSAVITQETAEKYFGAEDPIGRTVSIKRSGYFTGRLGFVDFTVSAVAQDPPANSSIRFSVLLPYLCYTDVPGYADDWGRGDTRTYLLLSANAQSTETEQQISRLATAHFQDVYGTASGKKTYSLQRLRDMHLDKSVGWGMTPHSSPTRSYVLAAVCLAVLAMACINFINLAIGRSADRSREVGVRKVVGARREQLNRQFLVESSLIALLSVGTGIGIAEVFLPTFASFVGTPLRLSYLGNVSMLATLLSAVVAIGIGAGMFPAMAHSRHSPLRLLIGRSGSAGRAPLARLPLVLQFSVSIALMVGTVVVSRQLAFLTTKDLGFREDQVIVAEAGTLSRQEQLRVIQAFRDDAEQAGDIVSVSATIHPVGREAVEGRYIKRKGTQEIINCIRVDYDYLRTLNIPLVEGRDFSRAHSTDPQKAVVVNESFVRTYGRGGWELLGIGEHPEIVGVARDFHFLPLDQPIRPLVMYLRGTSTILIRISGDRVRETLEALKDRWTQVVPRHPFTYSFLDEDVDRLYHAESRWLGIVRWSSLFALIIAALGAYGLASIAVSRRIKEIGVRKVLGATVTGITYLLSSEFAKLMVAANLIAWPLAYYAATRWLQGYAYRTELGVGSLALGGGVVVSVVLAAVALQTAKAALTDPARALRSE